MMTQLFLWHNLKTFKRLSSLRTRKKWKDKTEMATELTVAYVKSLYKKAFGGMLLPAQLSLSGCRHAALMGSVYEERLQNFLR